MSNKLARDVITSLSSSPKYCTMIELPASTFLSKESLSSLMTNGSMGGAGFSGGLFLSSVMESSSAAKADTAGLEGLDGAADLDPTALSKNSSSLDELEMAELSSPRA